MADFLFENTNVTDPKDGSIIIMPNPLAYKSKDGYVLDIDGINELYGDRLLDPRMSTLVSYVRVNADDAGDPAYYGYQTNSGNWYIMKNTAGAFTYCVGGTDYSTNWTGRTGLTYLTFSEAF